MRTRKELKRSARRVVRGHYWILLIVCMAAAYLGAEFSNSLDFVKVYRPPDGELPEFLRSSGHPIFSQAVWAALSGTADHSAELAAAQGAAGNPWLGFFGRSRGVLASIVNGLDSGSFVVNLLSAARNIGLSADAVTVIFILLAALLTFSVWFFLTNLYKAIARRIFLEARIYRLVPMRRMILFRRVKCWRRASATMFMTWMLHLFWSLTLIGGVVKHYSYYMVPFIVAENPDIPWRDAIRLSRAMMKGHKWECFVFECSFFLWDIAGVLTFGLTNLFYANQYQLAAFSEYYAQVRALAKEQNLPGSELLNDRYLFEKADEALLTRAYPDVPPVEQAPNIPLSRGKRVLANVFGITLLSQEDEKALLERDEQSLRFRSEQAALAGDAYPERLFPIRETQKARQLEHLHYLRRYSVPSLLLLFFIFSTVGWVWEVCLHLLSDGTLVNRGTLHGPWLPIYGAGGLFVLILLNPLRKRPVAEFFLATALCGCIEYAASCYLEAVYHGQRWWDYSGYYMNLHGRVCAEGLLVFGLGSMAIVYFAAPLLDNHLRVMKRRILVPLCVVLLLSFSFDQVYSWKHPNTGDGITSVSSQRKGPTAAAPDHPTYTGRDLT